MHDVRLTKIDEMLVRGEHRSEPYMDRTVCEERSRKPADRNFRKS
jgi:hypothetical protein